MMEKDEIAKNVGKAVLIVIFTVGGIGPFTFLKDCFGSEEKTTPIEPIPIVSDQTSQYSEDPAPDPAPDPTPEPPIEDVIESMDYRFIGAYNAYTGERIDGPEMSDLHIDINVTKGEMYSSLGRGELNSDGSWFVSGGYQCEIRFVCQYLRVNNISLGILFEYEKI